MYSLPAYTLKMKGTCILEKGSHVTRRHKFPGFVSACRSLPRRSFDIDNPSLKDILCEAERFHKCKNFRFVRAPRARHESLRRDTQKRLITPGIFGLKLGIIHPPRNLHLCCISIGVWRSHRQCVNHDEKGLRWGSFSAVRRRSPSSFAGIRVCARRCPMRCISADRLPCYRSASWDSVRGVRITLPASNWFHGSS